MLDVAAAKADNEPVDTTHFPPEVHHHAALDARLVKAARGIRILAMASWPAGEEMRFLAAHARGQHYLPQIDYRAATSPRPATNWTGSPKRPTKTTRWASTSPTPREAGALRRP
jgi:hypothetical protein